jgi:hypothetical protein
MQNNHLFRQKTPFHFRFHFHQKKFYFRFHIFTPFSFFRGKVRKVSAPLSSLRSGACFGSPVLRLGSSTLAQSLHALIASLLDTNM